jgi:hypothetical protein
MAGIFDIDPSENDIACATVDWNIEGPTCPTTSESASAVLCLNSKV